MLSILAKKIVHSRRVEPKSAALSGPSDSAAACSTAAAGRGDSGQQQDKGRQQRQRRQATRDEQRRPAPTRQQHRRQLSAEKSAQRVAGEHEHHDVGAVSRSHMIAQQGHGHRQGGADAKADKQPNPRQCGQRRNTGTDERGCARQREASDQQRLAADAVAQGTGKYRTGKNAQARQHETVGECGGRHAPASRDRRRRQADGMGVIAIENLGQGAKHRNAEL